MKKQIVLHVGMDKTGTTTLQQFLHGMRAQLETAHGLLVPRTGQWSDHSHHPFAFTALGVNGFKVTDIETLFSDLEAEMSASDADQVLLSSECLFKVPYSQPNSPIWMQFRRLFSRVRIVIYVRRQDSWIESRHRHSIVSGREISIESLAEPFFADYRTYIDQWANLFGKDNVTVRPFEKQQWVNGDICQDFLSTLGLPSGDALSFTAAENQSFSSADVLFRSRLHSLGLTPPNLTRINQILGGRLQEDLPNSPMISPSQACEIIHRYETSNAGIARDYLGRESGVLFLDPLPCDENWVPPCLTLETVQAIAAAIGATDWELYRSLCKAIQDNGPSPVELGADDPLLIGFADDPETLLGFAQTTIGRLQKERDQERQARDAQAEDMRFQIAQHDLLIGDLNTQVEHQSLQIAERDAQITLLKDQLSRLMESRSWRLTRPVRATTMLVRKVASALQDRKS